MSRPLTYSTPLMKACQSNDITPEFLEHVINTEMTQDEVQHWIDRTDPRAGSQPLMSVCFRHFEEEETSIQFAKVLMKYGANINTKDTGPGVTPLYCCAQEGRAKLLQFFIDGR
jgi:hypothetical protein